ncbi:choice-of-anchor A family protein [Streptomyces sp. H27-C3]|uniref:choice-of-anchor A family protein n=1 Tax=Streptomyces sp. H27-C3 TaxID=3046305 RepID=UPI0024B8CB00|nr:choice-of-anchor A family protein [Streptomyces sp. H27-C3]MDJ0466769.1 choice-of-anchor A family protein [Streptomyces sp. H27-C3]
MLARSSLALLSVGGGLLLGPAAHAAHAAPADSCLPTPLGTASRYAEFIKGSSQRVADTEGAVAVGGNATFGDPERKEGFSIGSRLTPSDLKALPGGYSLVVGGKLTVNQVVLERGKGVYRSLEQSTGGSFGIDGPHADGPSPVDFAKEFSTLKARSTAWGALATNGKVDDQPSGEPDTLLLEGDRKVNVFTVPAAMMEKARNIKIKVPAGATTLVNVTGAAYDMNKNAIYGVHLWDHTAGRFVLDDYQAGSAAFKDIRSKLLWNFPQASQVRKNYASWPGTILAPNALVSLGNKGSNGEVGPGHVNGSLIAGKLTSVSGAETHHMPFRGCLPGEGEKPPEPSDKPESPGPESPEPEKPGEPSPTPSVSAPPKDETSPSPSPVPVKDGSTPSGNPSPEGDLASTGSDVGLYAGLGATLLAVGSLAVVHAVRRRGQSG